MEYEKGFVYSIYMARLKRKFGGLKKCPTIEERFKDILVSSMILYEACMKNVMGLALGSL